MRIRNIIPDISNILEVSIGILLAFALIWLYPYIIKAIKRIILFLIPKSKETIDLLKKITKTIAIILTILLIGFSFHSFMDKYRFTFHTTTGKRVPLYPGQALYVIINDFDITPEYERIDKLYKKQKRESGLKIMNPNGEYIFFNSDAYLGGMIIPSYYGTDLVDHRPISR